ncbi:MAG: hypothetical protein HGA87_04750, partial [Desulfobulbaceae bacterium]|nr:hypothetical protein [Desulfobulbaceae bacterium]
MATNYIFVISRLFSVKFYIRIFFGIIFAILFFFKTNIANPNTTKTSNLKKYDLKNTNKVTISNNYFISQKHKTFNTLFNQSTLTINSCYIYSCIFKKGIDLSTSKITGKTDCQFNNFNNADFFQVFFENSAIFSSSIFLGNSTFDKCIFFRDANFDLSTFKGPTTFTKCTFYGNAKFNDSNFSNSADFQFVTFKGNLDLSHSKFNNNVDFSQATINNTLDIRGTKFTIAKFSGTDFHNLKTIYVDNETSFEKGEF